MTRGLLATSVFIAGESRGLDAAALPDELAVSIVTYAELRAGVLAATEVPIRFRRLTALQAVTELNCPSSDDRRAAVTVEFCAEFRAIGVVRIAMAPTTPNWRPPGRGG